ncbi:MAG: penicillin acylase family protein, partial [Halobacteriales archaeon]|nr:penicillin acylase family protein [Halobacteriales archaeon]
MRPLAALALLLLPALAGCATEPAGASGYEASVRWTAYGIPHVTGKDWGSLGYGYGYAFARDGLCVFAEEVATVRGERSLYWPPGDTYRIGGNGVTPTNEASDAFWRFVRDSPDLYPLTELRPEVRALMDGFAAGYDRWLGDTGVGHLPAACRGQAWVQPITSQDLLLREMKLRLVASSGFFLQGMFDAQPPLAGQPARVHTGALPTPDALGIGSNAYAYGSDATGGPGMLLGNPHFPWQGPERFHEAHLTIPGQLDVMGAAIYGMPLVVVGFTDAAAWSHTVSTAWRFTLHQLALQPGDPTSIVVDGAVEHLQPRRVTYQVRTASGVEEHAHTFWLSRWGPLVSLRGLLGIPGEQEGVALDLTWSAGAAFAVHDANARNTRLPEQWFRLDTARSFAEFQGALDEVLGVPWVNTIAASPSKASRPWSATSAPRAAAARAWATWRTRNGSAGRPIAASTRRC